MKKKFLLTSLTLLTMSLGVTACGTSNSNADGKQEITYSIWDKNQLSGMQAIADAFMEENPDIKVNVESAPWDQYWTKLEAGATGDTMADVFWMHGSEAERYMKNNTMMDLSTMIEESEIVDLENFPEGLVDVYSYDGKNYGIPKDIDTVGLWYNKTLFDEAGLAYPDETWDWEMLKEAANTLTDKDAGIYGFGAVNDKQQGYDNAIFQNEGRVLTEDKQQSVLSDPASQEALQWWLDFSLKDETSPTGAQFAENNAISYFSSGKLAMAYIGSWNISDFLENDYILENCDVAVLPQGKVRATIYNGISNGVSANTKQPEAALKFVEYLGSKTANEIQGSSGAAIPAYAGTEQTWVDKTSDSFNTQVYVDMLDYGVMNPNGPNYQKASANIVEVFASKLFTGEESVAEVTKEVDADADRIMQE